MSKGHLIVLTIIIFTVVYIVVNKLLFSLPQSNLNTLRLNIKNTDYYLEIARSPIEKAKGLSNRTSLCPNCGMIFIFDTPNIYPFWMKNTLIPLDMIWLDGEGRVVTIHQAVPEPNTSDLKLKNYANTSPAAYVIELNFGDSQKIGLKVGDIIDLTSLNAKN